MSEYIGQIVRSTAGRDQNGIFCVVGVEKDCSFLLLCDGKRRKAAHPKKKKPRHVQFLTESGAEFDHPVIRELKRGRPVSDRALRKALCAFKEGFELGKR